MSTQDNSKKYAQVLKNFSENSAALLDSYSQPASLPDIPYQSLSPRLAALLCSRASESVQELSDSEKSRHALMSASVFPFKYRSKSNLEEHLKKEGVQADGQTNRGGGSPARLSYSDSLKKRFNKAVNTEVQSAPTNNMGVTESEGARGKTVSYDADFFIRGDGLEDYETYALGKGKGKIVTIPKKDSSVDARVGFVDQVTFVINSSAIMNRVDSPFHASGDENGLSASAVSVYDAPYILSMALLNIFGFGITDERERGMNFYHRSFNLGEKGCYGVLSFGGESQKGTICVQIYGYGASSAKVGWESRLKDYLDSFGFEAKITRIDIAADFFNGQYSIGHCVKDYEDNNFSLTNRRPNFEMRGNPYDEFSGKTVYIGSRESGKLLRVYEKAKQLLGRKVFSGFGGLDDRLAHLINWTRIELELLNKNRELPTDLLINPGHYLRGAYPAFHFVSDVQCRISTVKKVAVATVEQVIEVARVQVGARLSALIELLGRDEAIDRLTANAKPARFLDKFRPLPDSSEVQTIFSLINAVPSFEGGKRELDYFDSEGYDDFLNPETGAYGV